MENIYWRYIASELVDAMLTVESEEEVIKRLLSMMTVEQLKSLDWFDSDIIDKIYYWGGESPQERRIKWKY